MKTNELTGAKLDWAVMKCRGLFWLLHGHIPYSTDWAEGGAIIEREKLNVWWAHHVVDAEGNEYGNHWYAETGLTDENADERHICMTGETPLIAAMRCYVASKLGDDVDVPEDIV